MGIGMKIMNLSMHYMIIYRNQALFIMIWNKVKMIFCLQPGTEKKNDIERFKCIAHLLFKKYIRYNAELEVNISGSLRNRFIKYDESDWNIQMDEFVNIFDDLIYQMFGVINQSFDRFHK